MKTLLGGALAASVLSLAVPATAHTTSLNPIAVRRVEPAPMVQLDDVSGIMRIAFENTAGTAAREVTSLITDGSGRQIEVENLGTFAKDITVRHNLRIAQLGDRVRVRVVRVELADGSAWIDSSPAAQPRRQAYGGATTWMPSR
jgi:hypothetical protein